MGEAKRRKQLDATYGMPKTMIGFGHFIPSPDTVREDELISAGIRDYGVCTTFTIASGRYFEDSVMGIAYPGLDSSGEVEVGMLALANPGSQTFKAYESLLREFIADEYLRFRRTGQQRRCKADVINGSLGPIETF